MPFTLIPLFPNEVTYQKQFFMVIYYVQCLHINFFHLIFVKPLNKRFGVPLYLAKTFNFKNYTRMAFKSDNLRNLDFRAESPQTMPHLMITIVFFILIRRFWYTFIYLSFSSLIWRPHKRQRFNHHRVEMKVIVLY